LIEFQSPEAVLESVLSGRLLQAIACLLDRRALGCPAGKGSATRNQRSNGECEAEAKAVML